LSKLNKSFVAVEKKVGTRKKKKKKSFSNVDYVGTVPFNINFLEGSIFMNPKIY